MWLKLIGGSVAGLFLAGMIIFLIEKLAHGKFEGSALFATVLVAYGIAAFVGGGLSNAIGGSTGAYVVGGLLIVMSAMNLLQFPHPWWFLPGAVVVIGAGSWAATKLPPF